MASIQVWTETLAAFLHEYSSCLFLAHPVSCCLVQRLMFHAHPSLPAGQLSTNVQVNNMATLHHIHPRGNSQSPGEFCVYGGIPCPRGNSVSPGEFRVYGGILCRRGNFVPMGEFRCRRNSVSTDFRVDGIPYPRNSVDTQQYILLKC